MRGFVAGVGNVVHSEEVRRIDHGAENVAVTRHLDDVLPGVGQIDITLPRHHPEDIERQQDACRMEFRVRFLQKAGDNVRALRATGGMADGSGGVLTGFVTRSRPDSGFLRRANGFRPCWLGLPDRGWVSGWLRIGRRGRAARTRRRATAEAPVST